MTVVLRCREKTVGAAGYRSVNAVLAAALATLVAAGSAAATTPDRQAERSAAYDRCMDMTRTDPQSALDEATGWQRRDGGAPARHCAAVALIGLRRYAEAAADLEALAGETPATEPARRVGLLAQAGQAWLLAGQPERAERIQGRAIDLAPTVRQLRLDRALSRLSIGKSWDAIDDLNVAVELDPRDPGALLYRASAYRYLDAIDLARDDVFRAIGLDPGLPEAWLERGILERMAGDPAAARRSWEEAVRLGPDSPAARAARIELEALGRR